MRGYGGSFSPKSSPEKNDILIKEQNKLTNGMIIAGNMLVDALKDVDVYPEHSHLTTIRRVKRALGGLVCNCALDLARLDRELPITVVGAIGDDDNGRFIREVMGRYPNISLDGVKVTGQTSFTDAMCDLTNRTRTFFTFRGASGELVPSDFDFPRFRATYCISAICFCSTGSTRPTPNTVPRWRASSLRRRRRASRPRSTLSARKATDTRL